MGDKDIQLNVGQRVRIYEEEDPPKHIGKMATVENIESPTEGELFCTVRIDRSDELVSLPQRYLKPVTTILGSLFANNLALRWDPTSRERFGKYIDSNWLAGYLLETLFYYNQIIIPTVDYAIVVPLVHWLGFPLFHELLAAHAISFVHISGMLSYWGNGAGLSMMEIYPGKEAKQPEPWWAKTHRCSPEEAVTLQLSNRLKGIDERGIALLAKFVELTTVDTALPQFKEKVRNETYRDIQGSTVLTEYMFDKNPEIPNLKLNHLPGLGSNQVRMLTSSTKPALVGDEIDTTLRLAELNLEAYVAEEAGARDMVTDHNYYHLLEAKAQRYTGGNIAKYSFSRLLEIENIPDVVSAITSGELSLSEVWGFRNSRNANEFREWFDKHGPTKPDELVKEYVSTLRSGGFWKSTKSKAIRFIVLQIIGVSLIPVTSGISFLATAGLGAADCFLLDKIRLGFQPRYYIDDLRNLFPKAR